MQFEYKEIISMEDRYLLLNRIPEEDNFEEEMLLYNSVPGLLPLETGWLSGEKYHRYCISGLRSLKQYLQGKQISGEQFESLFSRVFWGIRQAKEYMLREDGFWISPESIFLTEQGEEVYLCYVPEYHCLLIDQMRALSEWLLGLLDLNDEKAVYNGYAFHVLCHGESCSFQSIAAVLEAKPELPTVSSWEVGAEVRREEEIQKRKNSRSVRRAWFGGGIVFLAWIGALILWVMR